MNRWGGETVDTMTQTTQRASAPVHNETAIRRSPAIRRLHRLLEQQRRQAFGAAAVNDAYSP
jgi:hypothetical protein